MSRKTISEATGSATLKQLFEGSLNRLNGRAIPASQQPIFRPKQDGLNTLESSKAAIEAAANSLGSTVADFDLEAPYCLVERKKSQLSREPRRQTLRRDRVSAKSSGNDDGPVERVGVAQTVGIKNPRARPDRAFRPPNLSSAGTGDGK